MTFRRKTFLIDILHPAHVHFFRNIVTDLEQQGHRVIITARDKEISIQLLEKLDMKYILLSKQKTGLGLLTEMITRSIKLLKICIKEKPDLMMGIMGPSIAVVGLLTRIPSWVFYDTENAWITNWFAYPLADTIYTPKCYLGKQRKNEIRYPGYHELAYLHPDLFCKDPKLLKHHGINPEKEFIFVRFVGWQASHDAGERGLDLQKKIELIKALEEYAQVFISSETELPEELMDRQMKVPIEIIHHVLAFARLVVGESATMASEAAVLGVKAVFISDTKRGYTLEQESDYNLVKNFSNNEFPEVLDFIKDEFSDTTSLDKTQHAHKKLLSEKVNVAQYIAAEISNRIES